MTDSPIHMFFHDRAVLTAVYEKPAMLRVYRSDDLDTGQVFWAVHRSIRLTEDRPMYQPARELIGDAELLGSETVDDRNMMGGEAVVSVYAARLAPGV